MQILAETSSKHDDNSLLESATSDARLVEEVRRGNQDAFGELVIRYQQRMLRVVMRFISDQDIAQDLAQEAFIRAFEKLDQFDPSRRFGPWLFRIGVNLTMDYLRKIKRRGRWVLFSESPSEKQPDPASPDPQQNLELSQEIQNVLEELPEKYRTVLVLREMENFSTSEIAAILDRKEATIRWRLAEARNRFQAIWHKRLGDHDSLESNEVESDE